MIASRRGDAAMTCAALSVIAPPNPSIVWYRVAASTSMTAAAPEGAERATLDGVSAFVRPVPLATGVVSHAPAAAAPGVHLKVATESGGKVKVNACPPERT